MAAQDFTCRDGPLPHGRLPSGVTGWQADLDTLRQLTGAGQVTPHIGRTYPLTGAPEAIRDLQAGHARGKIVLTI
jgi:NADPH:quinone reductase-like Zn-dependent oxidoreductase